MAIDAFLKIGDITGEARDGAAHEGEIQVLDIAWGVKNSADVVAGKGIGAGKVNVDHFSFVKPVDRSSPILMEHCCNGKHINKSVLSYRKRGGAETPIDYLVMNFRYSTITSMRFEDFKHPEAKEDVLYERISFCFEMFDYVYTPQRDDGTAAPPVLAGWNIPDNVPFIN